MPSVGRGASAVVSCGLALAGLVHGGCARGPGEQLAQQQSSIVGGQLDTTSRGIVSLLKLVEAGYSPACTGTLLAPNLVLTARHCVADLDSPDGRSVECAETTFGATHPSSDIIVSVEANVGSEGLAPYQVAQVWLPPQSDDGLCGQDIAMLRLAKQIPAEVAQPLTPRLDSEVVANEQFTAIGYGLQDPDDQSGETMGQRMRVDDAQVFCTGATCDAEFVAHDEWIADSPVCAGDSGGPALDGDGRVAGVTSRGDPDCTVGIYTSVYAWRDFLRQSLFDAAAAGGYAPPTWAGEPPSDFPTPSAAGGQASGPSALESNGCSVVGLASRQHGPSWLLLLAASALAAGWRRRSPLLGEEARASSPQKAKLFEPPLYAAAPPIWTAGVSHQPPSGRSGT